MKRKLLVTVLPVIIGVLGSVVFTVSPAYHQLFCNGGGVL